MKRFCTACQLDKPLTGGIFKTGKVNRWVCAQCVKRMSQSPYARKEWHAPY
jgi:hypothetical protein